MKKLLPIQRIGLLILWIGISVTAYGLVNLAYDTSRLYDFLRDWIELMAHPTYIGASHYCAGLGTWLMIIGFLLSYAYPYTIQRLLSWIRYGRS